ncbi:MAG: homocysteine S-methyltransferase family protein [Candidatus Methylomirabilales bacterium]
MAFSLDAEGYKGSGEQRGVRERLGRELLVADGALGTMLQARGLPTGEPPEQWNITRPKAVQAIHKAYLAVGCNLVETNTFGANRLRLRVHGLDGRLAAINRRAVQLARRACAPGDFVAGTVGPTGYFHRGKRKGSVTEIASAFEEQLSHLIRAGVDLIVIETMTHLAEARVALQAARDCPALPVAMSLTFFDRGGGLVTLDDALPQEAVEELSTAQVVGCNCMDAEMMSEVLRQMRKATALPLMAQPHAGLPRGRRKKETYPLTPEGMVRHLPSLLASNLGILGGCCGTTPAHLEAVVRCVRRL